MEFHNVDREIPIASERIPLIGEANVWVEETLTSRLSVYFTQWIIWQALAIAPPGELELWVYDESLCGVAAPFAGMNEGGERLLRSLNSPSELKAALTDLRLHFQGVNTLIKGRANDLIAFHEKIGRSVEGFKLVVIATDITTLDDETLSQLATLLKVGPTLGVSFIIHSMTLDVNPFFVRLCDLYSVSEGAVSADFFESAVPWRPSKIDEVISEANQIARRVATRPVECVDITTIQDFSIMWDSSSRDGLTFRVGIFGDECVDITIGDEVNQRHNVLVTGAVGQGKSNLISVIIHSLCQRYSPDEVELVLLDFKEGVTLQRFYDEESGIYLPHASILGLEADRRFGLSVFTHLFSIYKSRMKLFKNAGVQSLREYRHKYPKKKMPRLLVIVDEFQVMFADNDRTATEIAELLKKAVRLFRACGIHFLLASQTIGGNMQLMGTEGDGVFAQVPIRIALKNSVAESQATLGINNTAAARLRSRSAIVNLDYGELSANRKCAIAFADESRLRPHREEWWRRSESKRRPYVFDGEESQRIDLSQVRATEHPEAHFGVCVGVGGQVEIAALRPEVGRNIALFGSSEAPMVFGAVASSVLASYKRPVRVTCLNYAESNSRWSETLAILRSALSTNIDFEVVPANSCDRTLNAIFLEMESEVRNPYLHLIVGAGMDRLRDTVAFSELAKRGPDQGYHIIGWWLKYETFQEQIGFGGGSAFDIRAVVGVETQTARRVFDDPLLDWKPQNNRMLIWDAASMPEPVHIIPYTEIR